MNEGERERTFIRGRMVLQLLQGKGSLQAACPLLSFRGAEPVAWFGGAEPDTEEPCLPPTRAVWLDNQGLML